MSLLEQIQQGRAAAPPRLLIYGTEGVGKAQPLDAGVLTPRGFVALGTLRVGDDVIGSDGRAHQVLGVYPQGIRDVYRVIFGDGSSTECCDDHLWLTQTVTERALGLAGAVRRLRDIRQTLRSGTHFHHTVPRVKPVCFAGDAPLPIDPWLLGVYLGEGCGSGNLLIRHGESFTTDVVVEVQRAGVRSQRRLRGGCGQFLKSIRELGLEGLAAHEQFIPSQFLLASLELRIALLQGLLDIDGRVTSPGAVEYSTTSPQLAADFCFLVRSLGGSAKLSAQTPTFAHHGPAQPGRLAYRIYASFPVEIAPISSEQSVVREAAPHWLTRHFIRAVEYVGLKQCQCIRIDAPDALYVTDDFLLTHNSTLAAQAPQPIFISTEDGLGEIDCHRFPLARAFNDVTAALTELHTAAHDYQTVVIDSLDWLERLVWDAVCEQYGTTSIEKVDGGYAKGYVYALTPWRQLLDRLVALHKDRQMAVILLAHAKVEKFDDPESSPYDRYSPRLHKHAAALLTEWCDAVLFATRKLRTQTEDAGFGRKRTTAHAIGKAGGERVLRTVGSPSCVAKNRYNLDAELPLDWEALLAGISASAAGQG